ncbi:MAG: hypothetical protein ACOC4G_02090 [Bacillota bacterium]
MDIPGCDPGHIKVGNDLDILEGRIRGNAKSVASAAYFYEKEGSLVECYHSIGWSGTLQDAKLIADGLLLLGVDYLVPHGFFYTTHGLKKHDAPPSFFYQMPYWPLFGKLTDRIDKINKYFKDTYIEASVLLLDPHSGIPERKDIEIYEEMLALLMENHIGFKIADTDILQKGEINDGILNIMDHEIKLVVIPPMTVIEEPLKDWLEKFENSGGKVIYENRNFAGDNFTSKIKNEVDPDISIRKGDKEIHDIWVSKREGDDKILWFILNTGDKEYNAEIDTGTELKELPLGDTNFTLTEGKDGVYKRKIKPFESFILKESDRVSESENINIKSDLPIIEIPVRGKSSFNLENKNLLRMYKWEMSLMDEGKLSESHQVPSVPLSNQLEEGDFSFTPDYKKYFGKEPELKFPELEVIYEYSFINKYENAVELVMEPGSIKGNWEIIINDNKGDIISEKDFSETEAHIRGSLGFEITDLLEKGENVIKVKLTASKANHGLQNPLYLAGNFGVELEPVTLVPLTDNSVFEDYESNLIPYYSGIVEYETEINISQLPDSDKVILKLYIGDEFHQAAQISINGGEWKNSLWEPRYIKYPTDWLNQGKNQIKIKVYTTLIRSFEGMKFDYKNHEYVDI